MLPAQEWLASGTRRFILGTMKTAVEAHDLLDRMMEQVSRAFTPASAQAILELRADESVQKRMAELAELANEGLLGVPERVEYERCIHYTTMAAILRSKARVYLKAAAA